MQKILWKDEYKIDVPEIDEQHRRLVEIINELYDLIERTPDEYATKSVGVLNEIVKYTEYHFAFEEKNYFRKFGYPTSDIHVMQHENFVQTMKNKFKHEINITDVEAGKRLYNTLVSWLLNHIAVADKSWATYIASMKK